MLSIRRNLNGPWVCPMCFLRVYRIQDTGQAWMGFRQTKDRESEVLCVRGQ